MTIDIRPLDSAFFDRLGGATRAQRYIRWLEVLTAQEQCLLNMLREQVGPNGDVMAAYCDWLESHGEERDYVWRRMAAQMGLAGMGCDRDALSDAAGD